MEAKLALCLILAIVSAEWYGAESRSGGAPLEACSTISPNPVSHGAQPQTSPVPYNIDISQLSDTGGYTPGQTYSFTLSGNSGEQFRGLLVLSRTVADNSPVGTFTVTDTVNTRLSSCNPTNIGITHSNGNDKTSVSFQWTAPPQGTGPIQFRFAVVQMISTYWADQSTAVVQELVAPTEATTTAAGVTGTASTDAQSSTMMVTDAQSSTIMATDTGGTSTSAGQPGGTTDMQGGGTSTMAEPAQTVPRSGAMKQSGVGFWTSILLIVMVTKAIIRIL